MSNDLFKDSNLKYHLNGKPKETPLAVCFEQVSKKFSLQRENVRSLQELFIGLWRHQYRRVKEKQEWFWVLKDINFEIRAGETVGFIGINGAGKSTLLKLISQVLYPTQGRIEVNGKIGALLEVGTGFHPDMTGRENIYLNGSILGLARTDIDQKLDQIIDFAEIGKFIDVPVKHYSSGMYLRLGFSVIINTDPDILLIDEVLSVGDASFQRKCMDRIYKLKERGTTILFVSHSPGSVEQLCQRAIWLDQGKIVADGEAYEVIMDYSRHFYELERKQVEQALYQETDVEEEADFVLNETSEITEVDSEFVEENSDEGEDGIEENIESEVSEIVEGEPIETDTSEIVEEPLQQWGANLPALANRPDDQVTFSAKDDDMGVVVVISHDIVGSEMAGPGIRYYHLARVLSSEFSVVLAVPPRSTLKVHPAFRILPYHHANDPALESVLRQARTILVPAIIVPKISILRQSLAPLIVDGYNPYLAETLVSSPGEVSQLQHTLTQAYLLGDFFICASERQRDWWLGLLEAHGRINQAIFQDDSSLRSLVDLVPFGLAEKLPQHTQAVIKGVWAGIKQTDKLILWGGGLWPWLDPLTAIRAVGQIWTEQQDIRLVFPGTRHPNPEVATMHTHHEAARELAQELGLLNQAVFFGDWIPYADWANVLLESDLALSLHYDTFETRLAFRSRVLEYVWAGLPTITTKGDATSELVRQYDLGIVVDYEDVDGVGQAILALLETPSAVRAKDFELAQQNLTWQKVAQPILAFCRSPRLAADKLDRLTLGNPFI